MCAHMRTTSQPMLRGDLVGSIAGVVRVSGEVAKEGSGGADGVRVFEATARGQFGWPQELCIDSRNSERPLARLKQAAAMARGQANVVVLEVEEHLPAARGGGHVLHMIVVLLDDVAAGAVSCVGWVCVCVADLCCVNQHRLCVPSFSSHIDVCLRRCSSCLASFHTFALHVPRCPAGGGAQQELGAGGQGASRLPPRRNPRHDYDGAEPHAHRGAAAQRTKGRADARCTTTAQHARIVLSPLLVYQ